MRRSGWFLGAHECARVLAEDTESKLLEGGAFGGPWPVLAFAGGWVVPGLPMVVRDAHVCGGVDGDYRRQNGEVWREAVGAESLVLTTAPHLQPPGLPFELLWFGDNERWVVRHGLVEIENLFAAFRVPVTTDLLDRLLIRGRRADSHVISGIAIGDHAAPHAVEVRRPVALSTSDRWRDPAVVVGVRADVAKSIRAGDVIEAALVGGDRAVFRIIDGDFGWRLDLADGRYPFPSLGLECHGGLLALTATLDRAIDVTEPDTRARVAFTLRSDLVNLG